MPLLEKHAFDELVARGCTSCGRNYLKLRALATATLNALEGDPVSSLSWTDAPELLPERVYRVECAECGATLFSRDDCPLCRAAGGLSRALAGPHGLSPPPRECPHCGFTELSWTVVTRLRVETILGRPSRRVAEAEAHEPGFHVVEASCRSCEQTVARVGDARCAGCGRSSLLKRMSRPT